MEIEGERYEAIFECSNGSHNGSYSDHYYYREFTIHYLDINMMIMDKTTKEKFFSRFRFGESEYRSPIFNEETLLCAPKERIIKERYAQLVDLVLSDVVSRMKKHQSERKIPNIAPKSMDLDELVKRGYCYNEHGEIETLFPIPF